MSIDRGVREEEQTGRDCGLELKKCILTLWKKNPQKKPQNQKEVKTSKSENMWMVIRNLEGKKTSPTPKKKIPFLQNAKPQKYYIFKVFHRKKIHC